MIRLGKDPTPKMQTTNCVYQINCIDCSAQYIGRTKRRVYLRINEHKNCDDSESVISLHKKQNNHEFDWKNIKILDRGNPFYKNVISEMLFINSSSKNINKREEIKFLSPTYKNICKLLN